MARLLVKAYAKLNLTLRVTGRLPSGYHTLCSLAAAVDWADSIHLVPRGDGISLRCDVDLGIPPEENLAFRAAELLLAVTGAAGGVEIELHKGIPPGSGLGGGSSDAAAVLAGLNELLGIGLTPGELAGLASKLGADVPFFLGPSPAWVEGIGERIRRADIELPPYFLVLVPPFDCPTAVVYRTFDELGIPPSEPDYELDYRNDLWPAALHVRPELARYRRALEGLGALGVGMTGSGSGLFAAFPDRDSAVEALRRLGRMGVPGTTRLVRPLPRGYDLARG